MYKVVIVDDEILIRKGLRNYFPWDSVGYEVVEDFSNGVDVLSYLETQDIDVLITDIKMPFMTGIELAKRVSELHPEIIILFLSGHKDFEYARMALQLNVKHYIVKPTKYDELFSIFTCLKEKLDRNVTSDNDRSYYDDLLIKAKAHILSDLKNANLNRTASHINLTPNYLSRIFKEHMGINFSTFLMEAKMKKAARYLVETQLKTYEIGVELGYSTPKNFTRTFKKYYGKTPREYRYNQSKEMI